MHRSLSTRPPALRRMMCAALVFAGLGVPAHAEPLDLMVKPRPPYYTVDDTGAVIDVVGDVAFADREMTESGDSPIKSRDGRHRHQ